MIGKFSPEKEVISKRDFFETLICLFDVEQKASLPEVLIWLAGTEDRSCRLGCTAKNAVREGKLDAVLEELKGGGALADLGGNSSSADNLNRLVARPVSASHVIIHSSNCPSQVCVTVFAVHVVGAAARVVLDPNAKVLDIAFVLLRNLIHVKNFTSRLLHLTHLVHKVPEARLGLDIVGGKEFHAVSWWIPFLLGLPVGLGCLSTHHLV